MANIQKFPYVGYRSSTTGLRKIILANTYYKHVLL